MGPKLSPPNSRLCVGVGGGARWDPRLNEEAARLRGCIPHSGL